MHNMYILKACHAFMPRGLAGKINFSQISINFSGYARHNLCVLVPDVLLLLFRHSVKSLNAQEERLATHAIIVGVRVRKINVVILTPETAGTFGA